MNKKFIIINSNKHLGDLLIGLNVVQKACEQMVKEGHHVSVLLDDAYKDLLEGAFQSSTVYYYPRKALRSGNPIRRAHRYLKVVTALRAIKADVAIDVVADSVSSMVTFLSGAQYKIARPGAVYKHRYDRVVDAHPEPHEYYRFHNALAQVTDLSSHEASYGTIVSNEVDNKVDVLLRNNNLENAKVVVIHPGATKLFKMWPQEHFAALIKLLRKADYSPVLIGAGAVDRSVNHAINQCLDGPVPDFCDQLKLRQLVSLFSKVLCYIGNDSGPMHLASASNIPAIAFFGPSDDKIWGPLSSKTLVLRGEQGCEPSCRKGKGCQVNVRCLRSISPKRVIEHVQGNFG